MGRWYNKAVHRRWRKLVMQKDNWLCQECLRRGKTTPATEAHHKIPIKKKPDLALDVDNGEALCWRCHQRHHIKERQKERKRTPEGVRIIKI